MPLQASKHLNAVVDALKKLPGVGPKAAQRMAFYLLQYDKAAAQEICTSIETALKTIRHCEQCNNFSEAQICDLCASGSRDSSLLCVVEMPSDVHSIEQTQMYRGKYFVLLGRLSPLDGIGPKEIGLDKLVKRASGGEVKEVVVATNFTTDMPSKLSSRGVDRVIWRWVFYMKNSCRSGSVSKTLSLCQRPIITRACTQRA